ncbi:MAG: ABC transporter permease [Verrucomicrobia bacterium]|nr:ABC transporter permease [Verrucomicrobiota bacterium]
MDSVVKQVAAKTKPKLYLDSVSRSILFLLVAYALMCFFLSLIAPNFFSIRNVTNVLRQMSMIGIIGVGMTMVIISGEIDLSVGSTAAFSGVLCALMTVQWKMPFALAALFTVTIACCCGFLIGLLRVVVRIPSFITSLALLTGLRSGAFLLSGGFSISPLPSYIDFLGNGMVGPFPIPVVLMGFLYVVGFIVMSDTPWGRAVYAVGGNEEAARLSGIVVPQIKLGVFIITAALASIAGLILASRLNSGTPTVAQGWELDVIAAVIIGGTSLFGGSGNVLGTLLGALFMATLQNGMVLMGLPPFSQGVVSGIVILAAVVMGALQSRTAS